MKRIEFIAPVEAMRGNLSGKQDLLYPSNDNKAYESPVGSVNYARNYAARFVGAKIAKTGHKYFAVRTKSATHVTAKSKKAMALLGGAGALYAALLKTPAKLTTAQSLWNYAQEHGDNRSFRAYMMDFFRQGLINHVAAFTASVASITLSIDNPWGKFAGTLDMPVAQRIRVKFWTQLVSGGIEFSVNGMKGVSCPSFQEFDDILGSNANVLGLTKTDTYIKLGGAYILDPSNDYVIVASIPQAVAYTTTDVAPV